MYRETMRVYESILTTRVILEEFLEFGSFVLDAVLFNCGLSLFQVIVSDL